MAFIAPIRAARAAAPFHRTLFFLFLPLAATVLLALAALPAVAQSLPGQDVASIHAWLREHNPELRALRLEADAARARIQPAGALPDPSLSITLGGLDQEQLWRSGDMGRENEYVLSQRFPLWGKRGLARTQARQEADASELDRDAAVRDALASAETSYVRYWHADHTVAVIDRRVALLRQVEEIAGVRYALGMAAQQDAIRAQVEQTTLQRERIERLTAKDEAAATLNAMLGRAGDAPLAQPVDTPRLPVPDTGLARAVLGLEGEAHPALLAQRARADAARTNVELQRRARWPDVTVGIGAMQRSDGADSAELMFEVEIPFQQRARHEREREARLLEDAANEREQATRRTLQGQLAAAWSQWTSARRRRELTENTLLPQADAVFQSALASYQVGEVDFGTLLEALNQWQGADLDRVDALRDELLGAAAVRAVEGDTP